MLFFQKGLVERVETKLDSPTRIRPARYGILASSLCPPEDRNGMYRGQRLRAGSPFLFGHSEDHPSDNIEKGVESAVDEGFAKVRLDGRSSDSLVQMERQRELQIIDPTGDSRRG